MNFIAAETINSDQNLSNRFGKKTNEKQLEMYHTYQNESL